MAKPLRLQLSAEQMRRGLDDLKARWTSLRGETKAGVEATREAGAELDETAKSAKNLSNAFSLVKWGAFAAVMHQLVGIARDFEEGQRALVVATGASGAALQALQDDARHVFAGVPQSIVEVSKVLGELDTRVTGSRSEIRGLTRDVLDFARISGTDATATARDIGQLLNAMGMEAADAGPLLDKLTFASQASGIGVSALARSIIEAGPAFVEMGFNLDRQIALFSEFEKVGARPQEVIGSLNIALTRMAQSGATDAESAFASLLDQIENAPSLLEAVTISSEVFGSRVGGKVAEDIREGRFAVDDFVEALQGADGTLGRTAEAALTSSERIAIAMNAARAELEPFGRMMLDFFVPVLEWTLDKFIRFAGGIAIAGVDLAVWFAQIQVDWNRLLDVFGKGDLDGAIRNLGFVRDAAEEVRHEIVLGIEADRGRARAIRDGLDGLRTEQSTRNGIAETTQDMVRAEEQRGKLLQEALRINVATGAEVRELINRSERLNRTMAAGVTSLEERVKLAKEIRDVEKTLAEEWYPKQVIAVGAVNQGLELQLVTLGRAESHIEAMGLQALELGDIGVNAAREWDDAFSAVLGAISTGVGGIAAKFASVLQAGLSGGIVGALGAAGGMLLGSIFGGGSGGRPEASTAEVDRMADAAKRAADALQELVDRLTSDLRVREAVARGDVDSADQFRMEIAQQRERDEFRDRAMAADPSGLRDIEAGALGLIEMLGGLEQALAHVAEFDPGSDLEQFLRLLRVQEEELEALLARQAEIVARLAEDFSSDIERMGLQVAGDTRGLLEFDVEQQRQSEAARASDLLDRGIIDEEQFARFMDLLGQITEQSLAEFDEAVRRATEAEEERTLRQHEDLDVAILIAQGRKEEADLLRLENRFRRDMAVLEDEELRRKREELYLIERENLAREEVIDTLTKQSQNPNLFGGQQLTRITSPGAAVAEFSQINTLDVMRSQLDVQRRIEANTRGGAGGAGGRSVVIQIVQQAGESSEGLANRVAHHVRQMDEQFERERIQGERDSGSARVSR